MTSGSAYISSVHELKMANLQTVASVVAAFAANDREKQLRSVFVGNIPYEATEEQLKEIFSEVGPVVTFRLVFDRETGKPKGYGFCEYKDQETALSAMRNLNAYELNGRTLRVDNAASERSKEELRNLQEQENMNRQPQIEPERAPEAISKAVASLPPEQMFELMKQMQLCIQNNPVQAKEILLQNAQLAYALLQAQVVMRIIPPESALSMLQKPNKSVGIAPQLEKNVAQASSIIANQPMNPPNMGAGPANNIQRPGLLNNPLPQNVPVMQNNAIFPIPNAPSGILDTFDQRNSMGDRDMRIPPASRDPRAMQIDNKFDPRLRSGDVQNKASVANPYNNRMQNQTGLNQGVNQGGFMNSDPRNNPLAALGRGGIGGPSRPVNPMGINQQRPASAIPSPMITSQDQEKAALIMQVLQLSPEQIASLPEEQKQSIMVLKDQIARSQQH